MSAKDDKIANLKTQLNLADQEIGELMIIRDDLQESLSSCQKENVRLLELNKELDDANLELTQEKEALEQLLTVHRSETATYKQRVLVLEASLTFADARINHMMEATGTKMEVHNNYNIGKLS